MADNASNDRIADLVLEGGGVKGIGLAGAVQRLVDDGYEFDRIAGTSAGAITASLVAAMTHAGEALDGAIVELAKSIDYASFLDPGPVGRALGPLKPLALAPHLMFHDGLYPTKRLHSWVSENLAKYGVRTFGDLRMDPDAGSDLPREHRYRLVVVASDLTQQRAIKLPWDYEDYHLNPDDMPVADAVVMSASIPFFFRPGSLRYGGETSTIVDGCLFSDYPISIFDRTDGKPPRWPTFGVRLHSRTDQRPHNVIGGPLSMAKAIAESLIGAWDVIYEDDPLTQLRSMFVDTGATSATDFDISAEKQAMLLANGTKAADEFLAHWDFAEYLRRCRGGAQ